MLPSMAPDKSWGGLARFSVYDPKPVIVAIMVRIVLVRFGRGVANDRPLDIHMGVKVEIGLYYQFPPS